LRHGISNKRWAVFGLILGIVIILAAASFYIWQSTPAEEPITWELTLVGKNNEQRVLSYEDVLSLPGEEARGGFFTTVGVINGPYEVRGVPLEELCALVGGVTANDVVSVSATDGYSMVFDYEQLGGDIETYDPITLHEMPHEKLMVLLTYEQDGQPLSHNDGRPLRIAVVGSEALLTEGHYWVKWVNKIEVFSLE
jgi:DMSO/TMAO reductase YedYZ molybdopterin-dependent catalytic subunit